MVDIRGFNKGMDTDSSPELLQNGAYTYAMNISNGSEGIVNLPGNELIPDFPENQNVGNEWICGSFFDRKRQRIIFFTNSERGYHRILSYDIASQQYIVLFLENPSPSLGTSVFNWDIYPQFNPNGLIKDIKVVHREKEGDLYYFVDAKKRLLKFNYDTLLEWTTNNTPLVLDYFKVIKAPPKNLIEVDVIDDASYNINNLYKKLFQFKYRFVYDDNEKSVWSAISKIALPANSTNALAGAIANSQNAITLNFDTGDINVSKIEIAGRVNIENVWSDFFLIDTLDKNRDNIADNTRFFYTFRNDSVYIPIDIQESNLLFDAVPDENNALELANGNTLVIGGLKDGYDRDLGLEISLSSKINPINPGVPSTLQAETRNSSNTGAFVNVQFNANKNSYNRFVAGIILFSGNPTVGDTITIRISGKNRSRQYNWIGESWLTDTTFNEEWSVTFESGWSITDLIDAFINHPKRAYAFNITTNRGLPLDGQGVSSSRPTNPFGFPFGTPIPNALYFGTFRISQDDKKEWWFDSVSVSIKRSFSFGESDVFPTYKWSGAYKFGLVYYSKDGKTNGVFTNNTLNLRTGSYKTSYVWTPQTSDTIIPENETAQILIAHTPPPWADYYHIVRTKELSCDFSLMVVSCNTRKAGGYIYLDIENIKTTNRDAKETSTIINYGTTVFVDGDRVRLLQKYDSVNRKVNWDTKQLLDFPILSVEVNASRTEIKLKDFSIDPAQNPGFITINNGDKFVLEIYRPAKVLSDEDLVYYEIGHKYDIVTDANGDRYHDGTKTVTNAAYWSQEVTGIIRIGGANLPVESIFGTGPSLNEIQIYTNRFEFDWIIERLKIGDYIDFQGTASNDRTFLVTNISISFLGITIFVDLNFSAPSPETIQAFTIRRVPISGFFTFIDLFDDGDYYYKTRTMVVDTGATFGPLYVAEKNFSELYPSAVWSQGRPLVVDENIKEEYYPAMLRFSQSYIYGTNINNLSRFYPNNFEEADASFGDILRLKTRENFIRLFQRFKTGMIPIYRQIIVDNASSSQVALSERLLNKPNYYNGEYGIDKYGSSLVSTDFGDYFVDTNNKAIVRVSLDGITNISDNNNLASWANENIKEDSFGLGCFNYENRNVIMLIGHIEPIPNLVFYDLIRNIVAYSETDKFFESFYGYTDAETLLFINGFVYTGYNGSLYIHNSPVRNNFYGTQQSSSITTVFNGGLQLKKTYTAIEELANGLWTGTISTGPLTNQTTSVSAADFQKTVGAYTINSKENKFNATIKRDQNSPGGKFQGAPMKGLYAQVALTNSLTTQQRLISVSLKYIQSPLTNS